MTCPSCGQENPEGARFCNACGAPLEAAAPAREQRKTVTVVFCDVTGSTALGERLDPESLRRVMARYFDAARAALERHGGTVEKFIGDAVMAVFGIPVVHEDDALRALRAAEEIHAALPDLGLQARIGVNTGEVVTGTEEHLATGDAVNVAARLEQAAEPDEILIGEATLRLARDAVEAEAVEPLALKGKSQPVRAYRLVRVLDVVEPFARHLDAPMVGRERERALLRQAYERARDERGCHLFTILGPAGIGKSRLVRELAESVSGEARVVSGRCLPYGEGITYWPLHEVLEQLDQELELGTPDETAWAARKLFEQVAGERPLVVVLDDVHWAEPTFLDLIEHVADLSRDAPILLVCLSRPELLDTRPAWGGGKLNATAILLEPLGFDDVRTLIANVGVALDDALRERIEQAAEGNPLFVEEMLAMLAEDGADGEVEVPPTIHALLAARLDRLEPPEREVVGRASVEGKVFHRGAVAELGPDELKKEVMPRLLSLVRKELIRPDHTTLAGEDAFRFRHLLIRDAAYQSLAKEARADLHERFAAWLERAAGAQLEEYEEILGYHLEQAYRYREELGENAVELGCRAAERLERAGRRADSRGDIPAAIGLLERAQKLRPADDPARVALLPAVASVFLEAGRFADAEELVDEALERARVSGDPVARGRARIVQLHLAFYLDPEGRADEARAEAHRLIEELEPDGDAVTLTQAYALLAVTANISGQFEQLEQIAEQQAIHARRAGDRRAENEAAFWRAVASRFGPRPAQDLAPDEAAYATAEGPLAKAAAAAGLAVAYSMQGRSDKAREMISIARGIYKELGREVQWLALSMGQGWVEKWAGDWVAAERVLREGCEGLIRLGERSYLSTAAGELAGALVELGRDEEAEEWTRRSEEAAASEDVASQMGWRQARARVLARRGEQADAERLAREAVEIGRRTDMLAWRGEGLLDLAEVLRLGGDGAGAAEAAREALELFEQKAVVPLVERARAFIAALPGGAQPPATA
jgi:class 3 adenylate cyclase/tetratricopeptide (TPR) repeat protein